MARIERFEDLIAWQKARALTAAIYRVTSAGKFARDFGLSGQIQRSTVSVMANIAEGFERGGRGEFHQFLSIAKGSCAETRSLLYVGFDVGYLTPEVFGTLKEQTEEVTRLVAGLRSAVDKQRKEQSRNG